MKKYIVPIFLLCSFQIIIGQNMDDNNSNDSLNLREEFLSKIIQNESPNSEDNTKTSTTQNNVIDNTSGKAKVRNAEENDFGQLKYRRSSLYTLMINDSTRQHFNIIKDAFGNAELSEKFNDHNIGPYLIEAPGGERDQSSIISEYLVENDVAKKLIAKWFSRNSQGEFNMNIIAERGSYNASDLDIKVALDSKRGTSLLADAGEELIGNTFVIINDYKYTNKEEVAKKASGLLSLVKEVSSAMGKDISLITDAASLTASALGKGYVVKTTSYLYQLEWNEEIAAEFYYNYWMDSSNYDPAKKIAFENSDLFKLKYVGSESAWADLQSSIFTRKSDEDLIHIATVKATDDGISKLQRKFEEFRTKSPLYMGDPIAAKIGLKEGVEKGDKFEVLEQVIDKNGQTSYNRVGIIKVEKDGIWDNSFMSEEDPNANVNSGYTLFKGAKNKFFSGMLIRQIN